MFQSIPTGLLPHQACILVRENCWLQYGIVSLHHQCTIPRIIILAQHIWSMGQGLADYVLDNAKLNTLKTSERKDDTLDFSTCC